MENEKKIIALGIGNILQSDEGVGVTVIKKIMEEYSFAGELELYDGGTTGMHGLLPIIEEAAHLVVIDAVNGPGEPGATYRYNLEDFRLTFPKKLSAHDVGFIECLAVAEVNGRLPESVTVIGIKPKDMATMKIGLTPSVAEKVDELVGMVLNELAGLGISAEQKKPG